MEEIRLRIREPGLDERSVSLGPGATVGRAQGNVLVLADPAASRTHLRLLREGARWRVEDAGSSSGTLVDGERTLRKGESTVLQHGCILTVGDTTITIEMESETEDGVIPKPGSVAPEQTLEVDRTVPVPLFRGAKKPPVEAGPAQASSPTQQTTPSHVPAKPVPPPPAPAPDAGADRTIAAPPMRGNQPPRVVVPAAAPTLDAPREDADPEPETQPEPAELDIAASDQPIGERTRRIETTELEGMQLRPKLLARNARMVVVGGGERRVVTIEHSPFSVGRSQSSQLTLNDASISTEHARVVFDANAAAFTVEDLGSRNGTMVGGDKLPKGQPRTLALPTWLRFGVVEVYLVDDASSSTAQERRDRQACDLLIRAGRLTAADKRQAIDAARAGRRHIGELVLQQTRLTVAEWVDAVERARTLRGGGGKWLLVAIALLAVGGIAYWFFGRG